MKKTIPLAAAVVAMMTTAGCNVDLKGKDIVVAQEYCKKAGVDLVMKAISARLDRVTEVTCHDGAVYEIKYTKDKFIAGGEIIPPKVEPKRAKVVSRAVAKPMPQPIPCCQPETPACPPCVPRRHPGM